jgi:choloylglycine hydrolase
MCTAATYMTKDFYFGRTLDLDFSYGDEIVIMPRQFSFRFREMGVMRSHYAMIGMAHVADGVPLYYEAVNEKGLGIAGLNFIGNAYYSEPEDGKYNVAPFELIPWLLGRCATVGEAEGLIENLNLVNTPFNAELPPSELHWMIADADGAVTLESTRSGIQVSENEVGILTNNPTFGEQMFQLNNYMYLSIGEPQNNFCSKLPLKTYSNGMGAMGLPGDWSSQSRFIKAAFAKLNSVSGDSELESISQFFHILGSVEQLRGCCSMGAGKYDITHYTSCCNTQKGIYYYTTYDNHQITAVHMHNVDLDGFRLTRYEPIQREQVWMQN